MRTNTWLVDSWSSITRICNREDFIAASGIGVVVRSQTRVEQKMSRCPALFAHSPAFDASVQPAVASDRAIGAGSGRAVPELPVVEDRVADVAGLDAFQVGEQ